MKIRKAYLKILAIFFLCCLSPSFVWAAAPPRSGRVIRHFSRGKQIQDITWWKNNKLARRKSFYRNGRLRQDVVYQSGKPVMRKEYDENGRLKSLWTAESQEVRIYSEDGTFRTITIKRDHAEK